MADSEQETQDTSNGHGGGLAVAKKSAVKAAAIAAAGSATAFAARKALQDRGSGSDNEERGQSGRRQSSDDSVLSSALTSAWDSARDSIVPMVGDASTHAGEYVGRHAPEIVRDTIVPQFIRGFERARKSDDD